MLVINTVNWELEFDEDDEFEYETIQYIVY